MEQMLNRHQLHLFLWGSKQWGINTGGAVRTSTLPIPFTNVFLAVASTSSEWCCPGCSATNTTVTTRAYQSNRPDVAQPNDVNWIIIGCQPQWGDAITFTDFSSSKCKADITLPISYSRFFKAICCDWGNGAVATAVVTKGLAQITLYVAVAATAKPRASWITIGQ